MSENRRKHRRIPFARWRPIEAEGLIDISLTGCFVATKNALPVGSRIDLDLGTSGAAGRVEISSTVVRTVEHGESDGAVAGMAVKFDDLDISRFELLAALIVDLAVKGTEEAEKEEVLSPATEDFRKITGRIEALETVVSALKKNPTLAMGSDGVEGIPTTQLSTDQSPAVQATTRSSGMIAPRTREVESRNPVLSRKTATPEKLVPEERFTVEEFTSLLRSNQRLERSRRFSGVNPTNPDEAILTGALETVLDWPALVRATTGRLSEGKLLELLMKFYERKLIDFA